jgi:hypothetical protein
MHMIRAHSKALYSVSREWYAGIGARSKLLLGAIYRLVNETVHRKDI